MRVEAQEGRWLESAGRGEWERDRRMGLVGPVPPPVLSDVAE